MFISILLFADLQGMDFTTDKLRSMVRKWQTLIEAHVDVKTTDGYTLRMFCIGFTKKRQGQIKRTAYAQSSQVCKAHKTSLQCPLQSSWMWLLLHSPAYLCMS